MAILDNTIVSVSLPQMQAYFHTDRETINWVATAYFLAQAAVIPITGYISDRIGTKTVFLTALAVFTIGSALCAVAPNEHLLIAFRVLQGIGGGALFPMAFAIIFRVFPPAERGAASAVLGVPVLLAPAFGPTIGGYLTTTFDWHAIFTINIPVGIIAFVLAAMTLRGQGADRAITGEPAPDTGRLDALGLVLAIVGFTSLVYGITEAGTHGWNDVVFDHFHLGGLALDMSVLRYLVLGGVVLIAFVVNELVVSDPVLDVRLFLNYTFTTANLLMWVISGLFFASLFLLPIFFQNVQGRTPLQSGAYVIVQGVAAAVGTLFAGRFYNRIGPRILVSVGFTLVTVGTIGFTRLDPNTTWQSLQVWLVLRGLGLGLTNIPLQTLALSVISNRAMARASSLTNAMRQVAGAVGLTALTTYFVQQTTNYTAAYKPQIQAATQAAVAQHTSGSPTDPSSPLGALVAQCVAQVGTQAQAIQACVQHLTTQFALQFAQTYVAQHIFPLAATHALNDTFTVAMIGCGIAIVLALFLGKDPAVEAIKKAAARGESISPQPAIVGE